MNMTNENLYMVRDYFTRYTAERDIEADTLDCDILMRIMYDEVMDICGFDGTYDDFYNFMVELFV